MPRTDTRYISALADEYLYDEGWYTQASAVRALAEERDRLKGLLRDALALLSSAETPGPRGPGEEPDQERGPEQKKD